MRVAVRVRAIRTCPTCGRDSYPLKTLRACALVEWMCGCHHMLFEKLVPTMGRRRQPPAPTHPSA